MATSLRFVNVLILIAVAAAAWINENATGTCAVRGLVLPLTPGGGGPRCTADLDHGAAVLSPFSLGTRLYFQFEDGAYYWGEVVSVDVDDAEEDDGSDNRMGSVYRYRVRWSDGDYTAHDHDHVASILLDSTNKQFGGAGEGKPFSYYSRPSSVIAPFEEPIEPNDGGDGRQTCKRVRLVEEGERRGRQQSDDGVEEVTPEELYVRYVARSAPVLIEGMWKEYIKDSAFVANWTIAGMARRWQEGLDLANKVGATEVMGGSGLVSVMYSEDLGFQQIKRVPGKGYGQVFPPQVHMNFTDFLPMFEEQERQLQALANNQTKQTLKEYVCLNFLPIFNKKAGGYSPFGRNIIDTLPPNPLSRFIDASEHDTVNVWAQGRERLAALHHDASNNILGVLSGTKTVYLIDPSKHDEGVYAGYFPDFEYTRDEKGKYSLGYNTGHNIWHRSPVNDVLHPDLDRLPKFREVMEQNDLIRCDMEPGDGLFIPEPWWHEVRNAVPEGSFGDDGTQGANVAINYWWDSNPMMKRLSESLKRARVVDWVRHGEELDEEFERVARRNRAATRREDEEDDSGDDGSSDDEDSGDEDSGDDED